MFFQQKTSYEILQIHPYMDIFEKGGGLVHLDGKK
jgi:hypothetical protein